MPKRLPSAPGSVNASPVLIFTKKIAVTATALALASQPLAGQSSALDAQIGGLVLMNGFYNSAKVNNSDVPQFVLLPDPPGGPPASAAGATIRQSRLTLRVSVPEWAGGSVTGEFDVDFFGGQQPSSGGRTFPLVRLRRAFAELTWRHVAVFAGQESPPIVGVNPSSIASIGFPEFAGAGNLWLWIPQIRVQGIINMGQSARLGVEVAALAPTSGDAQTAFLTQPDIAERSSRPYLQGRVRATWGQPGQVGELSLGGHYGWLAVGPDRRAHSKALAMSLWTPIVPHLELRAEAFTGQALVGLGGGGIGQSFGRDSLPVRTRGGWMQLNVRPSDMWEIGAGAGIDDPDDDDLDPLTARLRNLALEGHAVWRLAPVVIGGEVRRLRTRYASSVGDVAATQVNLAVGLEF